MPAFRIGLFDASFVLRCLLSNKYSTASAAGIDDKMRTTENRTAEALSVWGRLWRDAVFLISLTKMIVYYWIAGGRIRKAYRQCQARGEIYWVDKEPAETERRLR